MMYKSLFPAMLLSALLLAGCKEEVKEEVHVVHHYNGDVEVLNSCGIAGAALEMRGYLRDKGFDVVSFGNDKLQNYEETILVIRNAEWDGAQPLAQALKIDNVITVTDKRSVVDASIYLGKDFHKIIEPEQVENND